MVVGKLTPLFSLALVTAVGYVLSPTTPLPPPLLPLLSWNHPSTILTSKTMKTGDGKEKERGKRKGKGKEKERRERDPRQKNLLP